MIQEKRIIVIFLHIMVVKVPIIIVAVSSSKCYYYSKLAAYGRLLIVGMFQPQYNVRRY